MMDDLQQIDRLRRTMRRLALTIGLLTAFSIPVGYFAVSYQHQAEELTHHAVLSTERIAQYAYVQGATWSYASERLSELIAGTQSRYSGHRQAVSLKDGREVVTYGSLPGWPRMSESDAVVVNGERIGLVTVSSSLRPVLARTALVALFAILLGAGANVAMHLLPLRVLDQTLGKLRASLETVEAHATETSYAYEELRRQHRLVEETTQELMRARDEAMAADRTKSAFLATMSHELRTPLNAIIGFSEMMAGEVMGPLGSQRYRGYSESIGDSGRHLLAVINDVLDISKIEAGRLDLHLKEIELDQLLESCCSLVRPNLDEPRIHLELKPPVNPLPRLVADPVRLKQIVLNLLSNAMKFTEAGGRIVIEMGVTSDEKPFFSVIDTGIGMSEAEAAQALEPFQQVDNTHTRKYQGTGLGLPLAKALIEQHGGSMSLSSEPGKGTTVNVFLPRSRSKSVAA